MVVLKTLADGTTPDWEATVSAMLDDLIPWGRALQAMRVQRAEREEL